MVKILEVEKHDCEHLLGQFLTDEHYDVLINEDCDVYLQDKLNPVENNEKNIILKFRKNYFTKEEQAGAYDGLMEAAQPSQNRGLASGPKGEKCVNRDWATNEQLDILKFLSECEDPTWKDLSTVVARAKLKKDTRGMVWLTAEKAKDHRLKHGFEAWLKDTMTQRPEWIREEANRVLTDLISDTTYANPVDSGIAGWFDRYPRIPYGRTCAYNEHHPLKFKMSFPFLQHLSKAFKDLLPERWAAQKLYIDNLDPAFYVPDTVFTTITVNKNFRTAAHRDAGDLTSGFSNLSVVAKDNDYQGAYLVLPEVRAAVNIRPGDLLLVANHDYIHGNTPLVPPEGKTIESMERISLVCYFREKMSLLGEKAYEDCRRRFVDYRRLNKEHPLWRDGWNGISHGMWDSDEWFAYLHFKEKRPDFVDKYHPRISSLEALFA